jgi:hypothetical protein
MEAEDMGLMGMARAFVGYKVVRHLMDRGRQRKLESTTRVPPSSSVPPGL